jgi:hypothetical protein
VKTIEAIMYQLDSIRKRMFELKTSFVIPYIMLQVRVKKNNEVKMVFLDGKYHHTLSCSVSGIVMRLSGFENEELISFATSAIQSVSVHDAYILDGLVRVDIFNNDGTLVVNELESLEARFFSSRDSKQGTCLTFLENYWEKKIYEGIESLAVS